MLPKLENYYKANGILSTHFTCRHKAECKGDCEKFTGPKSAFIPAGYESESCKLPRLLFLSLDSGSGDKEDNNRLPLAVRRQEEEKDILKLHKGKHWYRTHELAYYILKRFSSDIKIEDDIKDNEARKYFAHANSAKCCMNKKQRKKADSILFRNCRKYLREELAILKPEIIVTQGKEAKEVILELHERTNKRFDEFTSVITLNGVKVFWLHTYHPGCWGLFNRQCNFDKERKIAKG